MKKVVKLPHHWDECSRQSRTWTIINLIISSVLFFYAIVSTNLYANFLVHDRYSNMRCIVPILVIISVLPVILTYVGNKSFKFIIISALLVISPGICVYAMYSMHSNNSLSVGGNDGTYFIVLIIVSIVNILTSVMVNKGRKKLTPNYDL